MTQTFTHDDILRYLYGETNAQESQLIESALASDEALYQFYRQNKELIGQLHNITLEPPQRVVDNIMKYARRRTYHPVD
ncbi:anti-sigma factor family protein [Catalinimonas alkaloidigena]|nr:hypothetical protein [Catalinimonas alkaloidigena]